MDLGNLGSDLLERFPRLQHALDAKLFNRRAFRATQLSEEVFEALIIQGVNAQGLNHGLGADLEGVQVIATFKGDNDLRTQCSELPSKVSITDWCNTYLT